MTGRLRRTRLVQLDDQLRRLQKKGVGICND